MNIEMKNLLNVSNHQLVCFKQITFKCLFNLLSILSFNPSESCHVFSQDWDVGHCFLVLFESDDILDPCLDRPKDIWITFGKGKIVFSFVWIRWYSRFCLWRFDRREDIWMRFKKGKIVFSFVWIVWIPRIEMPVIVFSFVWTRWHSRSMSWTSRRRRWHLDEVWEKQNYFLVLFEPCEFPELRCRSLFLVLFEPDDILDPRLVGLDGGEDIRMRFELALALAAENSVKLPDAAVVQAHEGGAPVSLEWRKLGV